MFNVVTMEVRLSRVFLIYFQLEAPTRSCLDRRKCVGMGRELMKNNLVSVRCLFPLLSNLVINEVAERAHIKLYWPTFCAWTSARVSSWPWCRYGLSDTFDQCEAPDSLFLRIKMVRNLQFSAFTPGEHQKESSLQYRSRYSQQNRFCH